MIKQFPDYFISSPRKDIEADLYGLCPKIPPDLVRKAVAVYRKMYLKKEPENRQPAEACASTG